MARMPVTLCLVMALTPATAHAQSRVGGHVGVLLPLVTRGQSATVTVADDTVLGFPTGITIKKTDRVAFDLELLPLVQNAPLEVFLTVHPGVLFSVSERTTAGVRAAFDVDAASVGFTPLIQRRLRGTDGTNFFIEADAPVRFQEDFRGSKFMSIGIAVHAGVGF